MCHPALPVKGVFIRVCLCYQPDDLTATVFLLKKRRQKVMLFKLTELEEINSAVNLKRWSIVSDASLHVSCGRKFGPDFRRTVKCSAALP